MEHSVIQITTENWVELESDTCTEPERQNYRELGQSVELESDPCREPERGRIQRTQQGESRELEEQEKEEPTEL